MIIDSPQLYDQSLVQFHVDALLAAEGHTLTPSILGATAADAESAKCQPDL